MIKILIFQNNAKKRMLIQAMGALIFNGDWKNFINGNIYKGNLKIFVCLS